MICKNCGNTVADKELFCEHCGELLDSRFASDSVGKPTETEPADKEEACGKPCDKKEVKKRPKLFRNICIAAVIGIFVLIGAVTASYLLIPVDLTDIIEVKGIGVNGYGSIEYSLDGDSLCDSVWTPVCDDVNSLIGNYFDYEAMCSNLVDCVTVTEAVNDGKLSNGDTVKLEISFNEKDIHYYKPVKGGTVEYTVSGLDEGKVIDPFASDYLNVKFEGKNGEGTVSFEKIYTDRWVNRVTYEASVSDGLKNGDVITVTARIGESFDYYFAEELAKGNVLQKKVTKKLTVSGLADYADADDIGKDLIKEAKDLVIRKYTEAEEGDVEVDGAVVIGVYFKSAINVAEGDARNTLDVILTYREVTDGFYSSKTAHVYFEDIQKDTESLEGFEMKEGGVIEDKLTKVQSERSFLVNSSDRYLITDLEKTN